MSASLFSDRWYRVVDLHPRLRANVRVDRQIVRDELWYLLSAGASLRTRRLNAAAWSFIGRCDGQRSVQEIWDLMLASGAEETATQDEVVQLLSQMYQYGLVEFKRAPDVELMLEQNRRQHRAERGSRMNPLSFRVSLGSPAPLLDRSAGLARALFSRAGLACWLVLMMVGAGIAVAHWGDLLKHAGQSLMTPRFVVIGWLCYPVIKLVHEASHALAVARWGGTVRDAGIGLFFLMPVPYVDASEASLFAQAHRRAWVSAAGIVAELAVAAIGLAIWAATEPGLIHDVAVTAAFIGGVSTVLFNANPLMRLDGYYLLCDLKELPNLAGRSAAYWHWLTVRYLLRLPDRPAPQHAPGERRWLLVYGPAAWAYRLSVAFWLTIWGGSYHPVLGILAGCLAGAGFIVLPAVIALNRLRQELPAGPRALAPQLRLAAAVAALLALLFGLPIPDRTLAQGVVWLPEQAHVRTEVEGFVDSLADEGRAVSAGAQIAQLEDPTLPAEQQRLLSRRVGLEAGLHQALGEDLFKSRQISEDIASVDEQLVRIGERRESLAVRSPVDGTLTVARPQDLPGRYLKRGEPVAYVIGEKLSTIRVAVQQEHAAMIKGGVDSIAVQLAQQPGRSYAGRLLRIDPAATERLPSAALGDRGDGDILTDPTDKDGLRTLRPAYLVDVEVPELTEPHVGGRAWVRFDYGWASAFSQAARYLTQVVLLRFSPFES